MLSYDVLKHNLVHAHIITFSPIKVLIVTLLSVY